MIHRADSQQVLGPGGALTPPFSSPAPPATQLTLAAPLHSGNFLGHFCWCLSLWLAVPAPPWHRPLSPVSQSAWHQRGGSTFWKVTDLFWGGGGRRSLCRGHPRVSTWSRAPRVSSAHSHLCQLRATLTHPLPLPLPAGQHQLLSPHLLPKLCLPLRGPPFPASPVRVLHS